MPLNLSEFFFPPVRGSALHFNKSYQDAFVTYSNYWLYWHIGDIKKYKLEITKKKEIKQKGGAAKICATLNCFHKSRNWCYVRCARQWLYLNVSLTISHDHVRLHLILTFLCRGSLASHTYKIFCPIYLSVLARV